MSCPTLANSKASTLTWAGPRSSKAGSSISSIVRSEVFPWSSRICLKSKILRWCSLEWRRGNLKLLCRRSKVIKIIPQSSYQWRQGAEFVKCDILRNVGLQFRGVSVQAFVCMFLGQSSWDRNGNLRWPTSPHPGGSGAASLYVCVGGEGMSPS